MECNIYHAAFLDLSEQQFTLLSDDAKVKYMMILNEVFEDRNKFYIVLELLEGITLQKEIQQRKKNK